MSKPTIKIVEVPSVTGHVPHYSYRCLACPDAGTSFRTEERAYAQQASDMHLNREHQR